MLAMLPQLRQLQLSRGGCRFKGTGCGALVHVVVTMVQVVEREVVGARNDAELVRLPVVIVDYQAVGITLTTIEDRERHVDGLADGEALHRLHPLVQQQLAASFLVFGGRDGHQA